MLQEALEALMKSLKLHASYLNDKSKYQRLHHLMDHPSATSEDFPWRIRPLPDIHFSSVISNCSF